MVQVNSAAVAASMRLGGYGNIEILSSSRGCGREGNEAVRQRRERLRTGGCELEVGDDDDDDD